MNTPKQVTVTIDGQSAEFVVMNPRSTSLAEVGNWIAIALVPLLQTQVDIQVSDYREQESIGDYLASLPWAHDEQMQAITGTWLTEGPGAWDEQDEF